MAQNKSDRLQPKNSNTVVSVISLSTLGAVLGFSFKFQSYVEQIVSTHARNFKPSADEIRAVCKPIVDEERERAREREKELKDAIDFIMRYYQRRDR